MYKRYMVFSWTTYDNVEPFQCIDFDTDNLEEAKKARDVAIECADEDGPLACIFDRIEGERI